VSAPVAQLRARLEAHGCRIRGRDHSFMACCPAHEDRTPSLHVSEGKDGRALLHCHAGCETADVLKALGLAMGALYPDPKACARASRSYRAHDPLIVGVNGQHVAAPAKSCDGVAEPALTTTQAAVLRCLRDHAFFAPTCCPSQELIAGEVGCTREYVNRVCRELRDMGLITWRQVRRPGSRWRHNVYTLLVGWHRPYRRVVMARIEAIRARVRGSVHTKSPAYDVKEAKRGVRASNSSGGPAVSGAEFELTRDRASIEFATHGAEHRQKDAPGGRWRQFVGDVAKDVAQQRFARLVLAICNRRVAHSESLT
jgi:hypothetical protein